MVGKGCCQKRLDAVEVEVVEPVDEMEGCRDELNKMIGFVNNIITLDSEGPRALNAGVHRGLLHALAELAGQFDTIELTLRKQHRLVGNWGQPRDAFLEYSRVIDRRRRELRELYPLPRGGSAAEIAVWETTQILYLRQHSAGLFEVWNTAIRVCCDEVQGYLVAAYGETAVVDVAAKWPVPVDESL